MATPTPVYYSLLRKGSSGPDVGLVQTWLNGVRDQCSWYPALVVDGQYGDAVARAAAEFQLRNKLSADGKVGKNTWDALRAQYAKGHGTATPYPGVVLRQGSSGSTVRMVQQLLNSEGERLGADGRFGSKTADAVRRYQLRHKLTADGSVGADTWTYMFRA